MGLIVFKSGCGKTTLLLNLAGWTIQNCQFLEKDWFNQSIKF